MAFLIGKVDRNISAYGVQLLTGGHILRKGMIIPAETEYSLYPVGLCLLHSGGNNLLKKLIHIILSANDRSDHRHGMTRKIMCMTVAAGRHHKTLAGMIDNFSLSFFNKCPGSLSVTCIDIPAVLYGKCFHCLILGSKYLAIDNEIRTVSA